MAMIKKSNSKSWQGHGETEIYVVSFIASVKWYRPFGKQSGSFLESLHRNLPYNPEIPLIGIYPYKNVFPKELFGNAHKSIIYKVKKKESQKNNSNIWTGEKIYKM